MVLRWRRVACVLALFGAAASAAAAAGCADTDPRYGTPEAIRGRSIDFGIDAGSAPPAEAGGNLSARDSFSALYKTFAGSGATCLPCHAAGGNGSLKFAPPVEADSYKIFKDSNYQNLTKANAFYTKGVHSGGSGPGLTAAQKTLTESWSAAEQKEGSPGGGMDASVQQPPADAGDGG